MKAVVKADFFDRVESRTRVVGETVDMTQKRIDEINGAFPGTVEKVPAKKRAAKEV